MDDPRTARTVKIVLRCYPARWRRRHGDEAAELAALLIRDGTPAGSIAWSYLAGAAREWLTPRPGRRLSTAACALLVAAGSLGASAGAAGLGGPGQGGTGQDGTRRNAPTVTAARAGRPQLHPHRAGQAGLGLARARSPLPATGR